MMKCYLNAICCFFLLLICSFNVQAKDLTKRSTHGFYLTWEGGYGKRDSKPMGNGTKSFEPGMNVGAAVGYHINPIVSAEIEFNIQVAALNKVTDTLPGPLTAEELSYDFMLNAYFHPWEWHRLTPYIGGGLGLGVALYSIHINKSPAPSMLHNRMTDKNIAYQLLTGFNYAFTNDLSVGLEYRYFCMPTLNYPSRKSSITINSGVLKINYLFNQTTQDHKNLHAETIRGAYLAAKEGVSIREKQGFGPGGTKTLHNGPFVSLALGRVLNQYFKAEAEISFRQNEVEDIQFPPESGNLPSGDEQTFAAMINAYLTPFTIHAFAPYIGVGIGYAYTTFALHLNFPPNLFLVPPTFPTFSHHNRRSDSEFAYQGMIGVNYPLSNHADIGIEYRYFRLHSIEYRFLTGQFIKSNVATHTVMVSFTYLFGVVT